LDILCVTEQFSEAIKFMNFIYKDPKQGLVFTPTSLSNDEASKLWWQAEGGEGGRVLPQLAKEPVKLH
jgi:hypothetical protein